MLCFSLQGGGRFGASAEYKHVLEETHNHSSIFMQTDTTCCAYIASVEKYVHPPFHPNFIGGLESLTEEYDEQVYRDFVDSFGTHYIKDADMGAIYGQQSMFTQDGWMNMERKGIDIGLYADYSAMDSVGFNLSMSTSFNQKWYEEWTEIKKEIMSYSYGAPPPLSGDDSEWHRLVIDVIFLHF